MRQKWGEKLLRLS